MKQRLDCTVTNTRLGTEFFALGIIVMAANAVEAMTGFGGTILAVAVAAFFLPIDKVLPVIVPVNLVLNIYLVALYPRSIDFRLTFRSIFPIALVGMAVGMLLAGRMDAATLKLLFGIFVLTLAVTELWKIYHGTGGNDRPLSRIVGSAVLTIGGIINGIFASGGPMFVYYSSRIIKDKAVFRSTLSFIWLVLNAILIAGYLRSGATNGTTIVRSLWLLPALLAGIFAGEYLHRRVDETLFKQIVYVILSMAGVILIARYKS